jgi:Fe(3+) dicitrate transport protein
VDPGTHLGWGFRNPYTLAYTYTDATLRSEVNAAGASGGAVESIFAGGRSGNRLPYIPRHQISLGTALEWESFGITADLFYITETWAAANNEPEAVNPTAGPGGTPAPDARFGRNSPYFLADVAVWYSPFPGLRLNVGAQNLLDRHYVASRLPYGPRPGHPRFLYAGLTWEY